MHSMLLTSDKDPMGAAIIDYLAHGKASKLRVFSSMFDEDEIPVNQLFRTFQEMPSLEQKALQLSTGKILDVGAGSGCHTLALQEMGKEVTAIDISPLSVEAMNKRGVKDARLQNFFDRSLTGPFDTILLLMNGSGIIGKLENLPAFFHRLKEVLARDGQLLLDSSDLSYLFEDEDDYEFENNNQQSREDESVFEEKIYRKKSDNDTDFDTDYNRLGSIHKNIERFIYFSSVDCIYKEGDEKVVEPVEIFADKFSDNYSHTKALATSYVLKMRKLYPNIKINILYPSAVIGKNDYKPSSIGKVVKDIMARKMQFGVKGGYNFIDVDDVVKATEIVIDKKIEGDFLLTGFPVTIYEFYHIVNRHLGRKKRTWKIPLFIAYLFIPFVPYLSKFVLKTINENYNYDNHKLKDILGLSLTTFDDTIDKTIKFFKEYEKDEKIN